MLRNGLGNQRDNCSLNLWFCLLYFEILYSKYYRECTQIILILLVYHILYNECIYIIIYKRLKFDCVKCGIIVIEIKTYYLYDVKFIQRFRCWWTLKLYIIYYVQYHFWQDLKKKNRLINNIYTVHRGYIVFQNIWFDKMQWNNLVILVFRSV